MISVHHRVNTQCTVVIFIIVTIIINTSLSFKELLGLGGEQEGRTYIYIKVL